MIDVIVQFCDYVFHKSLGFIFYYPLLMAYVWMIGGVFYYFRFERPDNKFFDDGLVPDLSAYPGVTLIVPCHNEEHNVRETVDALLRQNYPHIEIIAVNDCSKDRTGIILDEMAKEYPQLRVIHLAENQGKAIGLTMAAMVTTNEFLVCVDGDAILDRNAVRWFMRHFIAGPRVGAITGNPRIRNRSTWLGCIQVGEFSSIIGLIKRAQRVYGRLFTVSGVIAAFRKTALHDVGYWSPEAMTDDIDVSWKLQLNHWDIRFEPKALCWILMPETIGGLWKQRLRWAVGAAEVLLKFFGQMFQWRKRRMWGIYLEYFVSVFWAYLIIFNIVVWILNLTGLLPKAITVPSLVPGLYGVLLGITCLIQVLVSLFLDRRYDKGLLSIYIWMIWYPFFYWILNMATIVIAVPKVLFGRKRHRATWVSPDRGVR
ncbi:MAG: poly-beta-1,6-N-acetyl-D-glucosamine synthase [Pseudomonadota bacterium]